MIAAESLANPVIFAALFVVLCIREASRAVQIWIHRRQFRVLINVTAPQCFNISQQRPLVLFSVKEAKIWCIRLAEFLEIFGITNPRVYFSNGDNFPIGSRWHPEGSYRVKHILI